jgi:hypothetical protein
MGPIRTCADIRTMRAEDVRPIARTDFDDALRAVVDEWMCLIMMDDREKIWKDHLQEEHTYIQSIYLYKSIDIYIYICMYASDEVIFSVMRRCAQASHQRIWKCTSSGMQSLGAIKSNTRRI